MKKTVRYSEAFKLQVLRELETGRWESREAAARAYGLSGHATITYWVRKYGKEHLMGKVIRVEQAKELNEAQERPQVLECVQSSGAFSPRVTSHLVPARSQRDLVPVQLPRLDKKKSRPRTILRGLPSVMSGD